MRELEHSVLNGMSKYQISLLRAQESLRRGDRKIVRDRVYGRHKPSRYSKTDAYVYLETMITSTRQAPGLK